MARNCLGVGGTAAGSASLSLKGCEWRETADTWLFASGFISLSLKGCEWRETTSEFEIFC